MRVAIASCANLPTWEVDDKPFHAALEARGIEAPQIPWDAAGVPWGAFDAVLIRTTWDYQEKRDAFTAWADSVSRETRLFNPAPIIRWNTHKSYLRDLEARGVPVIPTVWLEAGMRVDVQRVCPWSTAFIKPCVGATARETLRFRRGDSNAQAHVDRLLPRESLMIQPYLGRVETDGECSAIFIDGALTHAVRKIPVPGDYRVQDDFGATDGPWAMAAEDAALARRVMASIGQDLLYGRVDFLRDDEGVLRVTEVELVEPSLFFRHGRHAAHALAEALEHRIQIS